MSVQSSTMRAARLYGVGDLRVEEVARPQIEADDQVLIRIHACGICPSDLRAYTGLRPPNRATPYTPGHEWVGEVVDAGDAVQGFCAGDRVVPSWRVACGHCYYCVRGRHNCCENLARGVVRGGFAEYGVAPARALYLIPEGVSYLQASFCEPLACCINGSLDSEIHLGDTVVVVGAGPIGLTHLQLAKHAGARVLVSDLIAGRLEKARELGADATILAAEGDPVAQVKALTGARGAEVVIAAVGAPPALRQALDMAAQYATVNFFAGTYPAATLEIDPNLIHYRQIRLTGSHDFTPHHFESALRLIEIGTVQVESMVSHRLPLAEVKEGFDLVAARRGFKVMIAM
jgi:L-iditol 2-dehydrogenase